MVARDTPSVLTSVDIASPLSRMRLATATCSGVSRLVDLRAYLAHALPRGQRQHAR
jgi:hypothetical protein